jgi:hypothetical protein
MQLQSKKPQESIENRLKKQSKTALRKQVKVNGAEGHRRWLDANIRNNNN